MSNCAICFGLLPECYREWGGEHLTPWSISLRLLLGWELFSPWCVGKVWTWRNWLHRFQWTGSAERAKGGCGGFQSKLLLTTGTQGHEAACCVVQLFPCLIPSLHRHPVSVACTHVCIVLGLFDPPEMQGLRPKVLPLPHTDDLLGQILLSSSSCGGKWMLYEIIKPTRCFTDS